MTIISTREFRSNQGKYLDLAKRGQQVVLKSRKHGSFKLSPVADDDEVMTKSEFQAMIHDAIQEYHDNPAEALVKDKNESSEQFIERLLKCTK